MKNLETPISSRRFSKPRLLVGLVLLTILGCVGIWLVWKKVSTEKESTLLINPKTEEPENPLEEETVTLPPTDTSSSVVTGKILYLSPSGSDTSAGSSPETSWKTIQKAVDVAEPGDTILLSPGDYFQDIVSRKDGSAEKRITIKGPRDASVKGAGGARIIEINHDYITLEGFTVDGLSGSSKKAKDYRDKLIYAVGKKAKDGVKELRIENMLIQNAGGECIRLRYFAEKNEIAHSTIKNCGAHDFVFDDGGKNGEGIYIGTAPEQRNDGKNPTKDKDVSKNNWVHHNTFDTQGNECVDIKEDSRENIVEHNSCTGQKDKDSGGMGSRGNENVFRYNQIFGNRGAGIRLGGDIKEYGINNFIYENVIRDNQAGGIKLQRKPQAKICKNTFSNNKGGELVGTYGDDFKNAPSC